jgi:hypothetical protein
MKNNCTRTHCEKIKLRCNIRQMRRTFSFVSQRCDAILEKLFQALDGGDADKFDSGLTDFKRQQRHKNSRRRVDEIRRRRVRLTPILGQIGH